MRTANSKIAETLLISQYRSEHRQLLNNFYSPEELLYSDFFSCQTFKNVPDDLTSNVQPDEASARRESACE